MWRSGTVPDSPPAVLGPFRVRTTRIFVLERASRQSLAISCGRASPAARLHEVNDPLISLRGTAPRMKPGSPSTGDQPSNETRKKATPLAPTRQREVDRLSDETIIPDTGNLNDDVASMVRGAGELFARTLVGVPAFAMAQVSDRFGQRVRNSRPSKSPELRQLSMYSK